MFGKEGLYWLLLQCGLHPCASEDIPWSLTTCSWGLLIHSPDCDSAMGLWSFFYFYLFYFTIMPRLSEVGSGIYIVLCLG